MLPGKWGTDALKWMARACLQWREKASPRRQRVVKQLEMQNMLDTLCCKAKG